MSYHCTETALEQFSRDHYTFINQIFGDIKIREYIHKIWKRNARRYTFQVIDVPSEGRFDGGIHHRLKVKDKKNPRKKLGIWCSADGCEIPGEECEIGYQNPDRDLNDTLCQSYTLLKYLGYTLPSGTTAAARKKLQMEMVNMYRKILKNQKFTK